MDAASVLQDLIRCRSVTPDEGGALKYLETKLTQLGFKSQTVTFSDDGTPDVSNLYARFGSGAPFLIFAGHTDVVPTGPEERWRFPPFSGEISDGVLYGRGAVDMKGGVAAFLAATADYLKENPQPRGSIGFLITGDEEGPAINGTVKLLKWAKDKSEHFDHCVLGEPSGEKAAGDRIKIGARGSFSATLTVTGKQGHVGYPEKANNPVPHLMRMLQAISTPLDQGNQWFPASNLEITDLFVGNEASNVIPRAAQAKFNVRFCDDWTLQSLEQELRTRLEKSAEGIAYELQIVKGNSEAFRTDAGDFLELVSKAVTTATGDVPKFHTAGGTSDARFIKKDCPVVEIGPAGTTLHQIDENITLADLERTKKIYLEILRAYFA
ncbi:MAG: succinyl-diaminopimelate desuccinylase [Pseudomonadota bacterium]